MNVDSVRKFLAVEKDMLKKEIGYMLDADRWQRRTPEILQMGSLKQLIENNIEFGLLTDSRAKDDNEIFRHILQRYGRDRG